MFDGIIDYSRLPKLDLHGEYKSISRVLINEFINDNIKKKNRFVIIIHGKGSGALKKETNDVLKKNKNVLEYKICYFNDGETIVKLNI